LTVADRYSIFAKTFVKRKLVKTTKSIFVLTLHAAGQFFGLCISQRYFVMVGITILNEGTDAALSDTHICIYACICGGRGVGTDADAVRLMQLWIYN
jgi:hypothetical protein